MKKFASALALLAVAAPSFAQDSKALEKRIEALELSRDLNWVKWGGSLESRYDYYDQHREKAVPTAGITKGDTNNQYYRLWANLNMEAKPTDRMTFFGRLSMAKYMNSLSTQGSFNTNSGSEGQVASGSSALFLERAFVNYAISDSLTFTMGRLPTIDGPNKHIALNQQMMGNYPTLAYSAILDGFALTKTINMDNSRVVRAKAIYTPSQTVNATDPNARVVDSKGNNLQAVQDGFYSGLVEFEQNQGSFFDKNLTILQYVYTGGEIVGDSASALGLGNLSTNVNRFTFYTEFQRIAHSNFDLAFQAMYSMNKSRGDFSANIPGNQGWMTDKSSDDQTGHATVVTARYQLPFASLNRPKIGAEWFNSSKQAFLYDLGNVNPINMYQSPDSDVYHLFWNQPFSEGLSMNLGWMYRQQHTQYAIGNLIGGGSKVDNVDQNVYVSLLATF